jgi:hypothetical protein
MILSASKDGSDCRLQCKQALCLTRLQLPGGKALNFSDSVQTAVARNSPSVSLLGVKRWTLNESTSGRRQGTRRCSQRKSFAQQFATNANGQGRRSRSWFHPGSGVRHGSLATTIVGIGGQKLLQKPFKAADADVEALLLVGLYQLLYTRVPAACRHR